MTDELDKLVSKGRALRAREEAAKESSEDARLREDKEARLHLHKSLSHYAGWAWIVLAIAAGVALAWAISPLIPPSWSHEGDEGDPATLVWLATACVPAPFFWLLRPLFGNAAVASERARIRALPFALTGYLESLSKDPRDWTVSLSLHFVGARPSPDLLSDAFRTIGAEVSLGPDTSRASARSSFEHESSPSTNGYVVRYVRRALGVLVALHGRHPLERVEVAVS